MSLAYADASAMAVADPATKDAGSVNERLQSIRRDVSSAMEQYAVDREPVVGVDPEERLVWWGNGGWRNGGWHNGGWGNGGLVGAILSPLVGSPGWHNGWRNW